MDRKTAESMMRITHSMGELIDKLAVDVEAIDNFAERSIFKISIAELAADTYLKIERHIIKEFPDLDPDHNLICLNSQDF